ncbi:MAG TPA: site-2 protease family protein [Actinomycetota bacterium]|nr:site-2 protease family protein [Actinomycetota bacterium]
MFGNSWRVGRVAGIEIRIDQSWILIALLITYSLYLRFTFIYRELSTPAAVILAVAAALLFFGSVLTHEMAHSLMAVRRKIPVRGITLFLFGGATHAKVESRGPWDEFVISVVGPLTSVALALVFGAVGIWGDGVLPAPVAGMFGYLGWVNLLLAIFNLVPGFPLDGGRVLRSAVWKATGSLQTATRVASFAGQVVGYLLVGVGIWSVFAGSLAGGIWFAFIGWFLAQAAANSYEQMQIQRMLEKVDAESVMARDLVAVAPDLTLQEVVDRFFMRYDHSAFPVEEGGRTLGLVTLRAVKRLPRERWGEARVREAMGAVDDQVTVTPGTGMDVVLTKLQDGEVHRVLVVEGEEVVGIITPHDVARWFRRREEIDARS